jgi:hypothetical protein
MTNITVVLYDEAPFPLPNEHPIPSGEYQPTDLEPGDIFPDAPAGPYSPGLSIFYGLPAIGPWSLYVIDDGPEDHGIITAWSLTILTDGGSGPTITEIPDQFVFVDTPPLNLPFTIADQDTPFDELQLTVTSSNPTLIPSDNLVLSGVDGNRMLTVTPLAAKTGIATITVQVSDGTLSANTQFQLTVSPTQFLTITIDNKSRLYGAANPSFTGILTGVQNGDNVTVVYACTATTTSAAGPYPIIASLVDPDGKLQDYGIITNGGMLTVTHAPLSLSASDATRPYGRTNPPFGGTISGVLNSDNLLLKFSTKAGSNSSVGAYAVVPGVLDPDNKIGNYSVSIQSGNLILTPASLIGTADNKTRPYHAPNPAFTATYSGFANDETTNILAGTLSGSSTAELASSPGTYPITVSGQSASNYNVIYLPGNLTVTAPSPVRILSIEPLELDLALVSGLGDPGVIYTIQTSQDATDWHSESLAIAGVTGEFQFEVDLLNFSAQFFRVVIP